MHHKPLHHAASVSAGALFLLILGVAVWSCDFPGGEHKSNTPPTARLANVPANDTIAQYIRLGVIPELTLYWVGDDPDGYVIAYKYRWSSFYRGQASVQPWTTILNLTTVGRSQLDTLILVRGTVSSIFRIYNFLATLDPLDEDLVTRIQDSLGTGRPFAVPYRTGIIQGDSIIGASPLTNPAPNKGTFIFLSPADSNLHKFEVISIDNNEAESPSPAVVHFWTLPAPIPTLFFNTVPSNNPAPFIIRHKTERFLGLRFTFGARDPSTFEHEYSWTVDDTVNWSPWSPVAEARVTAMDLDPIASGQHRIYARVRNRWGVVSPDSSRTFNVIVPPIDDPNYPKRIMVVNNDRSGNGTPGSPTLAEVRTFYTQVLESIGLTGKFDIWTTLQPPPGFNGATAPIPPRDTLARYSTVIFLYEQSRTSPFGAEGNRLLNQDKQNILRDYLTIGGNLIWSGTPSINTSIANYFPWADEIFHVVDTFTVRYAQNNSLDFAGSRGLLGYPDIPIDPAKIHPDSMGSIRFVPLNYARTLAQNISVFDSRTNDPGFEGRPLGIRYLSPLPVPPARRTYSVVYFGYPLYYGETNAVAQALRKALVDIGEMSQ